MAYKLVCIHEFFDDISGAQINRGDEIYDYTHLAQLVAANREHYFNRVWLVMAEGQWEWPPTLPDPEPAATLTASTVQVAQKAAEDSPVVEVE